MSRITVAGELTRTELQMADDARLIPALLSVVSYVSQRAGLSAEEEARLHRAAEHACESAFPLLHGTAQPLTVVVQDFPDRIEVSLEHSGEALPSIGVASFAAPARQNQPGPRTGAALLKEVDRVLYDTHHGRSRMTLVKYTGNGRGTT